MRERFKFHGVAYRQGFLEVMNVHPGHVNVQVWNIRAGVDLSDPELSLDTLDCAEKEVNTEIELNPREVEHLIRLLQAALHEVEPLA
jgi:hypothetical protein